MQNNQIKGLIYRILMDIVIILTIGFAIFGSLVFLMKFI